MAIGSPRRYYMGPKHTGELWVYNGTPLPNPLGNTGIMVCMYVSTRVQYGRRILVVLKLVDRRQDTSAVGAVLAIYFRSRVSQLGGRHTYEYLHACIPRRVRRFNAQPQFTGMFRSYVIGSKLIAINLAQILTLSFY